MQTIKNIFVGTLFLFSVIMTCFGAGLCSKVGATLTGIGVGLASYASGYTAIWAMVIGVVSIPLAGIVGLTITAIFLMLIAITANN